MSSQPRPEMVAPHYGFAVTSFTLGLVGLLLAFLPPTALLGGLCGIVGSVFGWMSWRHRIGSAGVVLSTLAFAVAAVMVLVVIGPG